MMCIDSWMDKENVSCIRYRMLFGHKDWNLVVFSNMFGNAGHFVMWNKPSSEWQILWIFSHRYKLKKFALGVSKIAARKDKAKLTEVE